MLNRNECDDRLLLYKKAIIRLTNMYCRSSTIANDRSLCVEDIEQEIRIAWLRAYQTHNPEKSAFNTHFHNVARNHMLNFIRSVMNNKATPLLVPLSEAAHLAAPDVIGDMEKREAILTIIKANLSQRDAQVVIRYFGIGSEDGKGLTQPELAVEFSITQQAVSSIIGSALNNPYIINQLQDQFL